MKSRLQKFIASSGLVSRRKAEELITAGRVFVNGTKVTGQGMTVDPAVDVVMVNGQVITPTATFRYLAFNKPVGVICTRAQYKNEKTVYDLIPDVRDLVIAGRLDKDSGGLLLLTNDGALTNQLTHPRYEHSKEYEVVTTQPLDDAALNKLKMGIRLEEGMAKFDEVRTIAPKQYRVVLHQGWKRQIRRMIAEVDHHIVSLTRTRINRLMLGTLKPGEFRPVQRTEII